VQPRVVDLGDVLFGAMGRGDVEAFPGRVRVGTTASGGEAYFALAME
jgi:hypothetical protein